jgi:stage V sporulation protein R
MTTYGTDKVEAFIDRVLSLENLMDVNCLFETADVKVVNETQEDIDADNFDDRSLVLRSFMRSKDRYTDTQKKEIKKIDPELVKKQVSTAKFPIRDVMKFLMEHAPLEEWQADIVGILREEAVYFLPQRMTKIMNEGWASYWHSTIMTKNALKASEIIDFADRHSGVMAMSKQNINPYKIGIELMRDIEFRWDTGRFGKEYLECDDMNIKNAWDKKLGLGRQKIFEVRKSHNDLTFIDEFFTEEFCNRMQIFTYKYNPRTGRNEIETRDFVAIKEKLLSQLTNFGQPLIEIIDDNHANRGELLLRHAHQGVDLDLNFASETMRNIYHLWSRPINLSTRYEDTEVIYQFDGKELKTVNK